MTETYCYTTREEYANRLREYRLVRGMSQPEVADELGVHYKTVGNWELGNHLPTDPSCVKIESLLDGETA